MAQVPYSPVQGMDSMEASAGERYIVVRMISSMSFLMSPLLNGSW